MQDELFEEYFPEYLGCTTQEMFMRPIPHATPVAEFAPLQDLIDEFLEPIMRWLFATLRAVPQAFEKMSRLGYPYFIVPDDKGAFIREDIKAICDGNLTLLDDAFTTVNIRLQHERLQKKRDFNFITAEGSFFAQQIDASDRLDKRTGRYCSRTRLVFNYPVVNLATQMVDNAVHKRLLREPMFQRNMYGWASLGWQPARPFVRAFDLKHCERLTGYLARVWAQRVGGTYGVALQRMLDEPFLVPAVGKAKANFAPMFIKPKEKDAVVQLGSGLSVVSHIQKTLVFMGYVAYRVRVEGYAVDDAIQSLTKQAGSWAAHNYGDDNFCEFSSQAQGDEVLAFLASVLPVEEETPAAFLGMAWTGAPGAHGRGGFRLRSSSYLLNWYLAERQPGSRFRPFPEHGWVARNRIYAELGTPDIAAELIPRQEDYFLPKYGITKEYRQSQLRWEKLRMAREALPGWDDWRILLGKKYLLDDDEVAAAAATMFYTHYPVQETAPLVEKLLSGSPYFGGLLA